MTEVLPENGLQSTLSSSVNSVATTISIQGPDASSWPAAGEYRAVLWQDPVSGPWELVRIFSGQGTSNLGVQRAAEPYRGAQLAQAWPSGTNIAAVITQDGINALLLDQKLVLRVQEFFPSAAADTVILGYLPEQVVMVARNGVVQSAGAGHYSVAGPAITFAAPFNGSTDRLVISFSTRGVA